MWFLFFIYVVGVILFTFYASVFAKGWTNRWQFRKCVVFGLIWPWTLISLSLKTR